MNKLKTKLIHRLGGYTGQETSELRTKSYKLGYKDSADTIKMYMETLYGLPSDEWCTKVYEHVCECANDYNKPCEQS